MRKYVLLGFYYTIMKLVNTSHARDITGIQNTNL